MKKLLKKFQQGLSDMFLSDRLKGNKDISSSLNRILELVDELEKNKNITWDDGVTTAVKNGMIYMFPPGDDAKTYIMLENYGVGYDAQGNRRVFRIEDSLLDHPLQTPEPQPVPEPTPPASE